LLIRGSEVRILPGASRPARGALELDSVCPRAAARGAGRRFISLCRREARVGQVELPFRVGLPRLNARVCRVPAVLPETDEAAGRELLDQGGIAADPVAVDGVQAREAGMSDPGVTAVRPADDERLAAIDSAQ